MTITQKKYLNYIIDIVKNYYDGCKEPFYSTANMLKYVDIVLKSKNGKDVLIETFSKYKFDKVRFVELKNYLSEMLGTF